MSVALKEKFELEVVFEPEAEILPAYDIRFVQYPDKVFLEAHSLKGEGFLSDMVGLPPASDLFGARVLSEFQAHKTAAAAIEVGVATIWESRT